MPTEYMDTRHRVRGYDCGYGSSLRPLSLANFFQEAAGDHAAKLGIGMDDMFAAGRTWMLSRIDIRMDSLPRAGDEITIRTWPVGTERIFALRCLEMRNAEDALIAGALYEYLIVDMEKRKPLRPERILYPGVVCDRPRPYADLYPGLQGSPDFLSAGGEPLAAGNAGSAGFARAFGFEVAPRFIDYNGHANNAFIIDWLCDAVPAGMRASGRLRRVKVDFVAELVRDDSIEVLWKPSAAGPAGSFASVVMKDGIVAARGYTEWA